MHAVPPLQDRFVEGGGAGDGAVANETLQFPLKPIRGERFLAGAAIDDP
jgi:hypothetical protein